MASRHATLPRAIAIVGLVAAALAKNYDDGPQRWCGANSYPTLDAQYANDHANYLCKNWTRSWRLPCRPVRDLWTPNWEVRHVLFFTCPVGGIMFTVGRPVKKCCLPSTAGRRTRS